VTPAATRVLDAAGQRYGFSLSDDQRPWGCDHFAETGAMMPPEGLDRLRGSDAILVGAVGRPDVPDHVLLWTV
jgi:tartrate dehydrogenase/decarboxylase/D-malate dehydrogenase